MQSLSLMPCTTTPSIHYQNHSSSAANSELRDDGGAASLPTPFVSAPSSPRLDHHLDSSDFDFSARFSDVGAATHSAGDTAFMPPMSTADELFLNGKIKPLNGMLCCCSSGTAGHTGAASEEEEQPCSSHRWSSAGIYGKPEHAKIEILRHNGDSTAEIWQRGVDRRRRQGAEDVGCAPPSYASSYSSCHCSCEVTHTTMSAHRRLHYHHRCEMMMMMMTTMMRANENILSNLHLLDDGEKAEICCAMHPHYHHHHNSAGNACAPAGMVRHQCDRDLKRIRHRLDDERYRWQPICSHRNGGGRRNNMALQLDHVQGDSWNDVHVCDGVVDRKSREWLCRSGGYGEDAEKLRTKVQSCQVSSDDDGDGDSLLLKKEKTKKVVRINGHGQGQKSAPLYAELRSLAAHCRCCDAKDIRMEEAAVARGRRETPAFSHRRARSLSPLRVFHMDDLLVMAPPRPSFESHLSYAASAAHGWPGPAVAAQEQSKQKPPSRPSNKRRTLKELLSNNCRVHECDRDRGGEEACTGKKVINLHLQNKKMGKKAAPCGHHRNQQQQQQHGHRHSYVAAAAAASSAAFFSGAHHQYTSCHKAQTEVLKRRTFLPYKHGLLGCLGFTSKSYSSMKGLQVLP